MMIYRVLSALSFFDNVKFRTDNSKVFKTEHVTLVERILTFIDSSDSFFITLNVKRFFFDKNLRLIEENLQQTILEIVLYQEIETTLENTVKTVKLSNLWQTTKTNAPGLWRGFCSWPSIVTTSAEPFALLGEEVFHG